MKLAPVSLSLPQPDDPGRQIDDRRPQCHRREQCFRGLSAHLPSTRHDRLLPGPDGLARDGAVP